MVEAVGVLGNLSIPNLDFDRLFRQFRLVDWVKSKLTSGERLYCIFVTSVRRWPGLESKPRDNWPVIFEIVTWAIAVMCTCTGSC